EHGSSPALLINSKNGYFRRYEKSYGQDTGAQPRTDEQMPSFLDDMTDGKSLTILRWNYWTPHQWDVNLPPVRMTGYSQCDPRRNLWKNVGVVSKGDNRT